MSVTFGILPVPVAEFNACGVNNTVHICRVQQIWAEYFGGRFLKSLILSAVAVACLSASAPGSAAEYFSSYTSTSGTPTVGSFWFTTADTLNAIGGYDILSAHGDVGGDPITGLQTNPNQPSVTLSATGGFSFNNVYYGSGPVFDNNGAVFTTASGLEYNIWSEPNLTYTLHSYYQAESSPGVHAAGPRSNGTLIAATLPPPAPPQSPPTHPVVLTFEDARTYSSNIISTQGFDFASAGHCCAYAWGISNGAGNLSFPENGTQRIIYNLYDLTMTANDGSAFTVTSLDAGNGDIPNARHSMLLTGTRADGSIVTTELDAGTSFATYALTNFSNIVSLTFAHVRGEGDYFTFDNLAVGPGSPTPEPATWALMIVGFGLVGLRMRRTRQEFRLIIAAGTTTAEARPTSSCA